MGRRTVEGDAVYAPIGLCYSCSSSGRFRSLDTNTSSVSGEVYFPDWRMQVFEVKTVSEDENIKFEKYFRSGVESLDQSGSAGT